MTSKLQVVDEDPKYRERLIKSQYVVEEFNKEVIQEMANLIADPKNLNIYFRSKKFEGQCELDDIWYHTKYSCEKFSESIKAKMINPNPEIKDKKIDLPPENTLLPQNFDLLPKDESLPKIPSLI